MPDSNFQDAVILNVDTLTFQGEQLVIGSGAGSKSVVFSNSAAALFLAASVTANRTVVFNDANGTIGLVTAFAVNGASTLSNGALVFSNSNNVTFGMNGSTITASASQSVQPAVSGIGVSTGGNTAGNTGTTIGTYILVGVGGISLSQVTAAGSLATLSISMTQSTGPSGIAAGTQTATSGTVIFSNSNGLSFGMAGSLTVTATADYVRSISAGGADATGNRVIFSNSNGIAFGANGATITASYTQAAAARVSMFSQWAEWGTNYTISNASISIQKVSIPVVIVGTQGVVQLALSGNSNSSGALTISMGVYTLNSITASLASSGSRQISWTSGSDTSASSRYGGVSGTRNFTFPIAASLTPGDYLFVFNFSTTNNGTWRYFGRQAASVVGTFDNINTAYFIDGTSVSSTAALPGSIVATDTNYARTGLGPQRQPGVIIVGTF